MANPRPTGFSGSGAEEPPFASASGSPADGVQAHTEGEEKLAQAIQKRQRLNLNDPAVQAAKRAEAAIEGLIRAEERLTRVIDARVKAQSGLSSGMRPSSIGMSLDQGPFPQRSSTMMRGYAGPPAVGSAGSASVGGAGGASSATAGGRLEARLDAFVTNLERLLSRVTATDRGQQVNRVSSNGVEVGGGRPSPPVNGGAGTSGAGRTSVAADGDGFERRGTQQPRSLVGMATAGMRANPMGALASIADTAGRLSDALNTPFMSMRDRRIQAVESLPLIGSIIEGLGKFREDLADPGGRGRGLEYVAKQAVDTDITLGAMPDRVRRQAEADAASYYQSATSRLPFRRQLVSNERESVSRSRLYQEDLQRLPADDRLRDAFGSEFKTAAQLRMLEATERRLIGMFSETGPLGDKRLNQLKGNVDRAVQIGKKETVLGARADLLNFEKERAAVSEQVFRIREAIQEARIQSVSREREVQDARTARAGVDVDIFRDREARARDQATNLGMLGVDGRMQAILAKQVVDQIGLENAPGALIGMASAGFPETVRNQAMQAGQQFQPQFQAMAPEEFRDTVQGSTKLVDEAMAKLRDMQQKAIQQEANALAEAMKGVADLLFGARLETIQRAIEVLKREGELRGVK